MSLRMRLPRSQGLGHTRVHQGMAIGSVQKSPLGLSWMVEEQSGWTPPPTPGALTMDRVTFQRLVNFLTTNSHTGVGHAQHPFSKDTGGINALAVETAIDQAADEVIGPRHPLFSLEGY